MPAAEASSPSQRVAAKMKVIHLQSGRGQTSTVTPRSVNLQLEPGLLTHLSHRALDRRLADIELSARSRWSASSSPPTTSPGRSALLRTKQVEIGVVL